MSATKHTLPFGCEITRDGRVTLCGVEVRQEPNADGYPSVRLTLNGHRTRLAVHRLVAWVYLSPRPDPFHEVRHLNGNKADNRVENLAWGTRKQNAADREQHGRTSRGASHSAAIKASNLGRSTRLVGSLMPKGGLE